MPVPEGQTCSGTATAMMDRVHLRRLLLSLIGTHQDRLVRAGRLAETQLVSARAHGCAAEDVEDIVVGEADLGLDSLDRLELVLSLTRFFGFETTGVEDYFLVRRRLGDWLDLTCLHFEKIGGAARLSFSTSGSTGAPKSICHDMRTLDSEIAALRRGPIAQFGEGRILAMVPPHHIYGFLWTVLLPQSCGAAVVDLTTTPPGAVFRNARPGDMIVATPHGWDMLGRCGATLPAAVTGITSGGPTTPGTWTTAAGIGLSRLIEIFGSSETGGVGWRDDGGADFALIGDVASGPDGLSRCGRRLDLPDRLDWTGPRRFRVLGRKDNVVQVAAVNVNLDALRRQMLDATRAEDVAIRLGGDGRLKAFVAVPQDREDGARNALLDLLRGLPAPQRPGDLRFGPALPRTAMGKLCDW